MSSSLPLEKDALREAIVRHLGLEFPSERWAHLRRQIEALMTPARVAESQWSRDDIMRLAPLLTVGETYFFRDTAAFDALRGEILPALIEASRERGRRLVVWSAGCSTGEEIYSIAILLQQLLRDIGQWDLTLLGTDVNQEALAAAREGWYGAWSFREKRARDCFGSFSPDCGTQRRLNAEIRERVRFKICNLVDASAYPFEAGSVDLLLCRNVLMYFHQDCMRQTMRRFIGALRPGGFLLLGASESHCADEPALELRQIDSSHCFMRKQAEPECAPAIHRQIASMGSRRTDPSVYSLLPETESSPPQIDSVARSRVAAESEVPHEVEAVLPSEGVLREARKLADRGRLAQARECAERAVRLMPLHPEPYLLLGAILEEREELPLARQAFRKAAYLAPQSAQAYFHLGLLAVRQQQRAEAVANLRRALLLVTKVEHAFVSDEAERNSARGMRRMIQGVLEQIDHEA